MTQSVQTRLDDRTLVVRIPMRFERRGGRKRIVAPDGTELAPTSKPQPDRTLVKAFARAWRWQKMLRDGEFATLAELAKAEKFNQAYISRVLRLTLLAPDIVERILDGRPGPGVAQLMTPFPLEWDRQRQCLLSWTRDDRHTAEDSDERPPPTWRRSHGSGSKVATPTRGWVQEVWAASPEG